MIETILAAFALFASGWPGIELVIIKALLAIISAGTDMQIPQVTKERHANIKASKALV